ncbi:MAG: hypothetical protein IPP90_18675 [Gemmatimonadaceae bacterium]|nr:hypothetical protein [Gemmatimonadaceae bacterium]
MAAARVLTMVERRVSAIERDTFMQALDARRQLAHTVRANVWVFESADEPGRFIEFTEAADVADVATVHQGTMPAPVWREVRGD